MLVTTARDPSAKARRLGRALAAFLSLPYLNRGKHSPSGSETWMVVVEDHGNPCGLAKRSMDKEELLAFRLLGEPEAVRRKSSIPVVKGPIEEAAAVAQFFELEWQEDGSNPSPVRMLSVTSGRIDFMDEGTTKISLKI